MDERWDGSIEVVYDLAWEALFLFVVVFMCVFVVVFDSDTGVGVGRSRAQPMCVLQYSWS